MVDCRVYEETGRESAQTWYCLRACACLSRGDDVISDVALREGVVSSDDTAEASRSARKNSRKSSR